jgi:membrane protease YdiL (CAAX protease family)
MMIVFPGSVLLGWVRVRSGKIFWCILMHGMGNCDALQTWLGKISGVPF